MKIERLYLIHERIQSETTGAPDDFAKEFDIKRKQLHNQLEELRLFGADIGYSRTRATYFYRKPFDFFNEFDYVHFTTGKGSEKFLKELLMQYFENKGNSK